MAKTTPMMQQYLEIKADYPDAILFFRLGDFYEMFMDDAVVASKVLDITLTSRNKGADQEIPLCGIPFHSCQPYIAKLIQHGHKVAICEQVEDPKVAKGIVKREVVRVVTPGLVVNTETLDPLRNNYLLAIAPCEQSCWGVGTVDITTGEFRITQLDGLDALSGELMARDPAEVLLPDGESGDQLLGSIEHSATQSSTRCVGGSSTVFPSGPWPTTGLAIFFSSFSRMVPSKGSVVMPCPGRCGRLGWSFITSNRRARAKFPTCRPRVPTTFATSWSSMISLDATSN